jgi:DNA-binding CsgD family transcriptional regulator
MSRHGVAGGQVAGARRTAAAAPRTARVAELTRLGLSPRQIGRRLGMDPRTVRTHRRWARERSDAA